MNKTAVQPRRLKPARPAPAAQDVLCCLPEEVGEYLDLRPVHGPQADQELALMAKALGHPARVRILRLLAQQKERICCEIVGQLPLAQSTVSEHLRILKDTSLIRSREDGVRTGYCLDDKGLRRLKALVAAL
jgi:ArsR family transcriptional regulator